MAVTSTPRLGLTQWSAGTDPFRRAQLGEDFDQLDDIAAIFGQGAFNARPAAGVAGRFYLATDLTPQRMFYDTGAAWVEPGAGLAQAADLPAGFGTRSAGVSPLAARADHVHRPGLPGEIKWGPWTNAPAGTFLADGAVKLRADEPDLFAEYGTKFNTGGELATEFRLPNIKGRVVVARDTAAVGADVDFDTVGETGGAKTVTLTTNEMPAHNHSGATGNQSADHTHSGGTDTQGNHSHGTTVGTAAAVAAGGSATVIDDAYHVEYSSVNGAHSHNFTTGGASANHTHSISSQGGGAAHQNMQPYIVLTAVVVR